MSHIEVSTQEVGTGKWFVITSFHPNSPQQRERAEVLRDSVKALGLHAAIREVEA